MTESTALVLLPDDPVVVGYREKAAVVLREASTLTIIDDPTKAGAVAVLSGIARVKAEAEAKRAAIVKPHNDYVKQVNAIFKAALGPIDQADALLREKLLRFDREQKRKAAEALAAEEAARLRAEALLLEAEKAEAAGHAGVAEELLNAAVTNDQAANTIKTEAPAAPAKTMTTPMGAATVRQVWTHEVTNLAEVPHAYMVLNEVAVRRAIAEGVREIPGLRIFPTDSVSVRR